MPKTTAVAASPFDAWPPILTTAQAGQILRIGAAGVRMLIRRRKLTAHRPGRHYLIFLVDLLDYIRGHGVEDADDRNAESRGDSMNNDSSRLVDQELNQETKGVAALRSVQLAEAGARANH